jgi:hypothetical protein
MLLLFHFAALRQELGVWQSVSALAGRTCVETAALVAASPRSPLVVRDLPSSLDGVFFLGNGFNECVELQAGRRLPLLRFESGTPAPSPARVLRWDPAWRRLAAAGP